VNPPFLKTVMNNDVSSSIAKIENTQIDSVNVRIYKPVGLKKDDKLPVIIYFHGG
jgi:acetyl esterase/lipase